MKKFLVLTASVILMAISSFSGFTANSNVSAIASPSSETAVSEVAKPQREYTIVTIVDKETGEVIAVIVIAR